jgi:ABC-type Mn2+/Zn2+ transport system permease subunit
MELTSTTPEDMRAGRLRGAMFAAIGSAVMALVFACGLNFLPDRSTFSGSIAGGLIWSGFMAIPMLSSVVYERKPLDLFLINAGFQLVAIVGMGAILAAWR